MKPLHPVIEERMAALELDLRNGTFKGADALRAAILFWVEERVRAALREATVMPPMSEAVVHKVLPECAARDAADLMLTPVKFPEVNDLGETFAHAHPLKGFPLGCALGEIHRAKVTVEQEAPMMLDIQKRHNERVRSLAGGNDPASMADAHARGLHAKDAGGRRDGCPECEAG